MIKNRFVDLCDVLLLTIEKEAVIHVSITEIAKELHRYGESKQNELSEVRKILCMYVILCTCMYTQVFCVKFFNFMPYRSIPIIDFP